jgi:hypothetical protein
MPAVTRDETGQVEGVMLTLLRHVAAFGYTVSVFGFPLSPLGTFPSCVEMPAFDPSHDSPTKHVARVVGGEAGEVDYWCACLLAQPVGAGWWAGPCDGERP